MNSIVSAEHSATPVCLNSNEVDLARCRTLESLDRSLQRVLFSDCKQENSLGKERGECGGKCNVANIHK